MSKVGKMSASEIIDFIENTEVFGCAIEMIERAELMQAELEKAHDEAVKDFCHFLIDKADGGSISVDELPDLVAEWRKFPKGKSPQKFKSNKPDVWLMGRFMNAE